MTRAVNIDAAIDHVIATSARLNAVISAIEPLVPSGTRVVFVKADDAALVTRAYGPKVLTGAVTQSFGPAARQLTSLHWLSVEPRKPHGSDSY